MTHFIRDYLLNVLIVALLLSLFGFISGQVKSAYYTYSDIDSFYESGEFLAFDVCEGDENQSIISGRVVKGTELGYQGIVSKELFKIEDGIKIKVFEEISEPFVEVTAGSSIQRIQKLPTDLEPGFYQWVLYVTLSIYDIPREVIPPLTSSIFEVKTIDNCV